MKKETGVEKKTSVSFFRALIFGKFCNIIKILICVNVAFYTQTTATRKENVMKTQVWKYAKKFFAVLLSVTMVLEAWGGLSFVSEAATSTTPEDGVIGMHSQQIMPTMILHRAMYITLLYQSNW